MDISTNPATPADPITTPLDPIPLPPERPEDAAPATPAVAPAAPAPVPPPLPRHDPAPASGFNGPRPGWWNSTEAAAASAGVNSDTLWKIAGIESAFGRNMGTRPGMGPFQIMPGTWDAIARDNPSLGLTDRSDLTQHGKAAAALLRANGNVLRTALGRAPTDGEQYLVWFGGTGAGLKATQAPADTPVTAIFSPAAIAANRSILGNGMTVGGLRRWADAKMAGQHYAPAPGDAADPLSNPSGGVGWDSLSPQMPISDAQKAILSSNQADEVWSLTHAAAEATTHDNIVAHLLRNNSFLPPDPDYIPTAAAIAADPRAKDIDKAHYPYLLGAQSDADMGQRIDALRDDLLYQRKMAERGWSGSAIRGAVSLFDPAGFALAALSPVGGAAAKFGTMSRILASGAEGAALGTGIEGLSPSPSEEHANYLGAAASGFLFGMGGGALGAIMHPHPDVAPAFADMTRGAKSIVDDVTSGGVGQPFGSTAGAAQNLGHVEPVRSDISDFTHPLFAGEELGKAALKKDWGFLSTRFDLAGTTKGSENPLTAALGSRLVEDAVGNADHSAVNRAVSVEATMIRERQDTALARAYQDAWGEFQQRNAIPVRQRATAEAQFRDAIADAIDNVDPTQAHGIDPAVTRAADAYRRNFADFHELAQNPGLLDGSQMAPLKGMAEVQANPQYFPHIYDFLAFNERVRRFGDAQMKGLLRDSILSHIPDMAPEDAERVASGLYKGLRNVSAGQEVSRSRMLSGDDQEGLRSFLGAETDMSAEAIDRVIGALNPPSQKGTIARTKRATPINVHYEAALKDPRTGEVVPVKAKDFMERDAVRVTSMYNRQMAAQVALARLRVANPRWVEPEMVFHPGEEPAAPGPRSDPATGKPFQESDAPNPEVRPGEYGPVPDGSIRYFHGSKNGGGVGENGGRWVTPSYEYARDFRSEGKPNTVHYVDVKQSDAEAHGGWDEVNGYAQHFEAPEHIAKGLQRYGPEDRLATIPKVEGRSNLDTARTALRQLTTEAEHNTGTPARLSEFRKVLGNYSREEQDAILAEVIHAPDMSLSQISDNKAISPEEAAAAYSPAGEPNHLIRRSGPYHETSAELPEGVRIIHPEGADLTKDRRGLEYVDQDGAYKIVHSALPDANRGKGTGAELYRQLLDKAQHEGKEVHSDNFLTVHSAKVWEKLKSEGYDIAEAPEVQRGSTGSLSTDSDVPVYTVKPAPKEAPQGTWVREAEDPANPRYLVDGIRGPSEMDTLLKKVRAIGDELGHAPEATERDTARLQFMYDAITGHLRDGLDKGKLGQFVRILKALNFSRVMNQVGFAQMAEIWTGVAQVGIRAALSSMPEFRQLLDGIRGGRGQTDFALQLEHMATPGTEMLRGSMHMPMDDLHNAVGRTGTVMDRAEHYLHKATRATSIMSGMAPLTAYQSKWMAKAALARFAMDATGEKALNAKRMRVLGISEEEQALIRQQLREHDGFVEGESGTRHRVLNLDAWDPQARHALEYGLHVWVRKMIQENDIGQMNMMLGSSMGRLMGQFRMFMFGAYTKNTLYNIHMRDFETLSGILGGSVMGAATYAAQVHLQSLGRSDRDDFLNKRLSAKALASAAISRGAFSSILPMVADLGTYFMGSDPMFDTRVSGGAAQGALSNPSIGLANNVFDAGRGVTASLFHGEQFSQRDARALQSIMPFSNFLPVVWATNAMIGGLPNRDTHRHLN